MIIINRKNMKQVVELAVKNLKMNRYNSDCFSTSDIRREQVASSEISSIVDKLLKVGVNPQEEFLEIFKEWSIKVPSDFVKSNSDFEIKAKFDQLETYIANVAPELVVEDEVLWEQKEYRKFMEIGNTRFAYELWETTPEAIEFLTSICSVFKSATEIIAKITSYYDSGSRILDIQSFCEKNRNMDSNCTSYLITIGEYNEYEHVANKLFIKDGGFYRDIIFARYPNRGQEQVERIFPLEGFTVHETRAYSMTLNKEITESRDYYESCKTKLLKSVNPFEYEDVDCVAIGLEDKSYYVQQCCNKDHDKNKDKCSCKTIAENVLYRAVAETISEGYIKYRNLDVPIKRWDSNINN